MPDLLAEVERLRGDRTPFVLATVVRVERPTSAKAGDRAIVLADGTLDGFVGGTCAESTVRLQGLRLLATGESTLLRITASDQPGPSAEGMVTVANPCLSGGTLDIFLEAMLPPPLLYVFGDAPVAQALVTAGAAIGYEMRTSRDVSQAVPPDADAVVIASHGRDEPPVLTAALRAGVPYVALVASRRRGSAVLAGLDVTDEERARVHSPAGLDIGARTPGEVAVSVLAEFVANRPRTAAPARPASAAAASASAAAAFTAAVAPATGPSSAADSPAGGSPAEGPAAAGSVAEGSFAAGPAAGSFAAGPAAGSFAAGPAAGSFAAGSFAAGSFAAGPAAAVDPVCGMSVAITDAAPRLERAGEMWYFCGTGCRHAAAADPERYLVSPTRREGRG